MRLYECIMEKFKTSQGFSDPILSTIRVKQGCLLSPTLFGIYGDELLAFLQHFMLSSDGCYIHLVLISMLLLVADVVFLASSL